VPDRFQQKRSSKPSGRRTSNGLSSRRLVAWASKWRQYRTPTAMGVGRGCRRGRCLISRPTIAIALVLLALAGCGGSTKTATTAATHTQAGAWTTAQRESVEATCKAMAARTHNPAGICDCIVPQAERAGRSPELINHALVSVRLPRVPSATVANCERKKAERETGK
jgi:hypothetical protein